MYIFHNNPYPIRNYNLRCAASSAQSLFLSFQSPPPTAHSAICKLLYAWSDSDLRELTPSLMDISARMQFQ